ncbi:MAG: hypothetical protein E7I42_20480, partial [Pluralibacter gergoviae]|nr:hypothetical protein [Pluralibacter gergoviae]
EREDSVAQPPSTSALRQSEPTTVFLNMIAIIPFKISNKAAALNRRTIRAASAIDFLPMREKCEEGILILMNKS